LIVGDPSVFAVESSITQAYERLSLLALGFFVIYVGGRCYGRRTPDSTMLACSYDEVGRRIGMRGGHTGPFAADTDAGQIADAFRDAIYTGKTKEGYFGIPVPQFCDMIQSKRFQWAPDGDEAFDDGSCVLQFDVQDRVRVIAFSCGQNSLHDPATLHDIWLSAADFYSLLQSWRDAFQAEWASIPKVSDAPV
jgi:hypothetical protein